MKDNSLQVFIGRANPDLGRKISNYLGIPPGTKGRVADLAAFYADHEADEKSAFDI